MKYTIIIITVFCLSLSDLFAQNHHSDFNVYMTYSHSFGLREKNVIWNLNRNDGLYANSFHIKGMYRIYEFFSCGIGFGADALRQPRYTTFPIYASIQFNPIYYSNWFLYNNIGYSLNSNISYPGLHYEAGIGYQWKFKKHFGIFLNAGYTLKQMQNIKIQYENKTELANTTRQSLFTGFGFIF